MTGRILPLGEHGLLAELGGVDEVMRLYRALDAARPPGVVDLVPAARTIAVTVDPAVLPLSRAHRWLESTSPAPDAGTDQDTIELRVRYDGADLSEVARYLGVSEREVVARHTASVWRVAFCGFAPGFGYLVTDHDQLTVPRRATPRTVVPAGSVGLAGEFSGVYPRSSPGGWQLIGSTDAVLWDPDAADPALLRPGAAVRFVEEP